MKTLSLTVKELTALKSLRKEEMMQGGEWGFMHDAYDYFKNDNADVTSQGFASLIGHLEDKGAFEWKVEGIEYYTADDKELMGIQYSLTEEAGVLADNN